MVGMYKEELTDHYELNKRLLGFHLKERIDRNNHLAQYGYYDRILFYHYLSQNRIRNPHENLGWALIATASMYCQGNRSSLMNRSCYLGLSATLVTLLRHMKQLSSEVDISDVVKNEQYIVSTLDNNQKGYPKKIQRFGVCNDFVKVTGMTLYQDRPVLGGTPTNLPTRVQITYINQAIPSPFGMPSFESIIKMNINYPRVLLQIASGKYDSENANINVSGSCIEAYMEVLDVTDKIIHSVTKYLTGMKYLKRSIEYKCWDNMPTKYVNSRKKIVKRIHALKKDFLLPLKKLQYSTVKMWNPSISVSSKMFIPPVSIRDDIETDGYGMAVIELLSHVGFLVQEDSDDSIKEWKIPIRNQYKKLLLCIDGLSMDRHHGFYKKLLRVASGSTSSLKNAITFKRVFNNIIEVSGPLHIAFHILQTIFSIFNVMFKWAQKVIQWKKITVHQVSDNFRMCKELCFLVLDEASRLSWDMFLYERKHKINELMSQNKSEEELCIDVSQNYILFINHERDNSPDEFRRYFFNFISMSRFFRQFWISIRNGDRIAQESIINK